MKQRPTPTAIPPEVAVMALRVTSFMLAAWGIGFGLLTLLGGQNRWAAAAYRVALGAPGAPTSWGVALMVAGFVLALGVSRRSGWLVAAGGVIGFAWCLLYGTSLLLVAWDDSMVGFAPVFTQFIFGVQFAVRAAIGLRWRL